MRNRKSVYDEMREKRISEILNCAQNLFLKNGIGNITMKEIALELAITRATLYKYFRSIEEIANEIEYISISNFSRYLEENKSEEGNAINKIEKMIGIFESFADEYPKDIIFTSMYDTYFGNSVTDEKHQNKIEKVIHTFSLFYELIKEGQTDGTVRSDIDAYIMNITISNMLVAMMQKMTIRGEVIKREQHMNDVTQIYEIINNMILNYIKA